MPLVWVVYPEHRAVTVYELGLPPATPRSGDVLTGGNVIPGFEREIDRIFAFPLGKRARGS